MEFYSSLNSKKADNVNKALTFEGLRDEFIKVAGRFYKAQNDNAAELKEIKASGIYSDKYIQNKESEFQNKEAVILSECVAEIKEATKKVIDTKKAAINLMLTKAPTQEQLNLLQSLQLQGKSLSRAEITAIIPELANNYRALKTMQSIAQGVGFSVVLPPQYDFEEISRSLAMVENYLADRINELGKPVRQWGLASGCFFGPVKFNLSAEEWEQQRWSDPNYSDYAEVLDGNVQTAPIVEPVKKLTDGEKDILNNMFADKYGDDLKSAVNKAAESPNIADLISRSEYAEYVEEGVKEN